MRYEEYLPPDELSSWVKLFWVFESRANDPIPETIVADGFPELIIHFRLPFAEEDRTGQLIKQPVAVACGQLTRPLVLHSSRDAGMIGIRFQPYGMAPFLSTHMQSITDTRVPADEMFVDIDRLIEDIMQCDCDYQRVAACNRFLLRSIGMERGSTGIRRALDRILLTRGQISIESLADLMGTSRRSLEVAFQKEVGVSPKMYCRITRFRHLFDVVSNEPSVNWVHTALESGFFDQSHLIRDFRRFAGAAPKSFLSDQTTFAVSVNQV